MKKIIKEWNKKLVSARENLEIHSQASTNMDYTSHMRDTARSSMTRSIKYIELLERTIELLEGVESNEEIRRD